MTDQTPMQVAQFVASTEAEGPGRRFALWLQGCPMRCPGCCNPEFIPFRGGTTWTVGAVLDEVAKARDEHNIEGLTLIGGEPLAHARPLSRLSESVQKIGLSVMVFTGYTLEHARGMGDADVDRLLAVTDLLIDGQYERDKPDDTRRWVGSTNQRIHFLTDRYREDDAAWRQRDTLEIRLRDGELTVNGFPAASAAGLWKGLKRTRAG